MNLQFWKKKNDVLVAKDYDPTLNEFSSDSDDENEQKQQPQQKKKKSKLYLVLGVMTLIFILVVVVFISIFNVSSKQAELYTPVEVLIREAATSSTTAVLTTIPSNSTSAISTAIPSETVTKSSVTTAISEVGATISEEKLTQLITQRMQGQLEQIAELRERALLQSNRLMTLENKLQELQHEAAANNEQLNRKLDSNLFNLSQLELRIGQQLQNLNKSTTTQQDFPWRVDAVVSIGDSHTAHLEHRNGSRKLVKEGDVVDDWIVDAVNNWGITIRKNGIKREVNP